MAVRNNQIEVPFTEAEKAKLSAVQANAESNPDVASQPEAEAGVDNAKMMTPLRVSQAILALVPGAGMTSRALLAKFSNGTAGTLSAFQVVRQNTIGEMDLVSNLSDDAQVQRVLGVLSAATLAGEQGDVVLRGIIENVITPFVVGDQLFLNNLGQITTTVPEIGNANYVEGNFVVRVGQITKNPSNPAQKDLEINVEVRGVL